MLYTGNTELIPRTSPQGDTTYITVLGLLMQVSGYYSKS